MNWNTRKLKSLFKIKDENLYLEYKIYCEEYKQCRDNYIGETV